MEERIKRLLDTYTFEEILDFNDTTIEEVIEELYNEGFIQFPPEPVG
jgi:hypothetical protein